MVADVRTMSIASTIGDDPKTFKAVAHAGKSFRGKAGSRAASRLDNRECATLTAAIPHDRMAVDTDGSRAARRPRPGPGRS